MGRQVGNIYFASGCGGGNRYDARPRLLQMVQEATGARSLSHVRAGTSSAIRAEESHMLFGRATLR
jgi:hypothetical protein